MLKLPSIFLILSFLTLPTLAKNQCGCSPIPTSKAYIGAARKRHIIGYSIDWSCTYRCIKDTDLNEAPSSVTGAYHGYYIGSENGTEGICEGMVYKSEFSAMLNQEVYMYMGENFSFKPSKSKSADLKKWAETNNCD